MLFHNFHQINIKAASAHPIIQKEVQKLLAKGAVEPLSDSAGFYSSVFVVPMHLGGLHPVLSLKQFNHNMHVPSFRVQTIKWVWQLIQQGDYAFSIYPKDAY